MIDWTIYTFLLEAKWHLIAIALTALSFLGLTYFIWRNGQRKWWKTTWTFIGLLALLCTVLQPAKWEYEPALKVIFLTKNANSETVDSLLNANENYQLFGLSTNKKYGDNVQQVPNFPFVIQQYPQIETIAIVGDGLPLHELDCMQSKVLDFYLNESPSGITAIQASHQVMEGKPFYLSGIYHQKDSLITELFLERPSGVKSLLTVNKKGNHSFQFQEKTKEAGRFLYHILEKDKSGKTIQSYPIPLVVEAVQQPRVLVLNQAPTFESKYLLNWLAEEGYVVASRSTISKGKYKETFFNRPNIDLKNINQKLLSQFDIYIINEHAFAAMPIDTRQALRTQIESGKGLLLLGGDQLKYANILASERQFFLDSPMINDGKKVFQAKLEDFDELPEMQKTLYRLSANEGLFPILKDKDEKIIAGYKLKGLGKLAISFLQKNYLLKLKGKPEAFQAIWNQHLQAISPQYTKENRWELEQAFLAKVNAPSHFKLFTTEKNPKAQIKTDSSSISIPLGQNPNLAEQWTGMVWFETTGWQSFSTQKRPKNKTWIYVPASGTWTSLHRQQLLEDNWNWQQHKTRIPETPELRRNQLQAYPQWWFFLGFLFSMTMLWIEEKF